MKHQHSIGFTDWQDLYLASAFTIYKNKTKISGKSFIALQWILQDVVLERSPSYFETRRTTGSPELQ